MSFFLADKQNWCKDILRKDTPLWWGGGVGAILCFSGFCRNFSVLTAQGCDWMFDDLESILCCFIPLPTCFFWWRASRAYKYTHIVQIMVDIIH